MKKIKTVDLISIGFIGWIINSCIASFSSDAFFMIVEGKEILANGFPHEHKWFVMDGLPIVVQQWLYDIWLAFLDSIGTRATDFSILAIMAGIILTGVTFFKFKGKDTHIALLLAVLPIVISDKIIGYLSSIRPEAITILLCMLEILALEKYKKTNNKKWLLLIPLILFLEANIHISMWIMHICILMAYVVPSSIGKFKIPGVENDSIVKDKRTLFEIIGLTIALCLVTLLNPYTIDGTLYVFKALSNDTFDIAPMLETLSVPLSSSGSMLVIAQLIGLVVIYIKRHIKSTELWLSLGVIVLEMNAARHMMWWIIPTYFILNNLYDVYNDDIKNLVAKVKSKHKVFKAITVICTVFVILTYGVNVIKIVNADRKDEIGLNDSLDEIRDYMEETGVSKDAKIYTGLNHGAYFEYYGYTKLFLDPRPELYNVETSYTKTTILKDYDDIFCRGLGSDDDGNIVEITDEEVEAELQKYDFEYVVVDAYSDINLYEYLTHSDKYELLKVNDSVQLWKRVK